MLVCLVLLLQPYPGREALVPVLASVKEAEGLGLAVRRLCPLGHRLRGSWSLLTLVVVGGTKSSNVSWSQGGKSPAPKDHSARWVLSLPPKLQAAKP